MLKAGVTEVCITPPVGVDLSGYFAPEGRPSTDIHDHLMAQALVLDDGHTQIALITSDLLAVTPDFVRSVRQEVAQRTSIPAVHVMVCCAHIHTAPATASGRDIGRADPAYVHMVARHCAGAVTASVGKLQAARLYVGHSAHHGLAWNRLGKDDVNPALYVVRVDTEAGAPLAMLVHYACHPVILGPKSIISADYPGALRRYLKRQYPGGAILFANGAAGDIDPLSNRAAWGQGTFDDVERTGAALGADAWRCASEAAPVEAATLAVRQGTLRLAYDPPSPETIRAHIARCQAEIAATEGRADSFTEVTEAMEMPHFWLRYYRALEERIRAGELLDSKNTTLQAFVIGETLAMLAIPGELFTAEGRAIQAASPYTYTLPICYANGAFGYLAPRDQFEAGGYAATLAAAVHDSPPFRPDVAERVVEAAAQLLAKPR